MKTALIVIVILAIALASSFVWMGKSSRDAAPTLGLSSDRFLPCPESPNCVSSDAGDEAHRFALLTLNDGASWPGIVAEIEQMDGVTLTDNSPGYLRAEVRSPLFGFVDDLELHQRNDQLALRSASRVGYSDMGANRKRLEAIESRLKVAGMIN